MTEYVLCSYEVYAAAKAAGIPAASFGGGVTEKCYEVRVCDLDRISEVLGRPVRRGTETTYDDIPNRGRVAWRYVS